MVFMGTFEVQSGKWGAMVDWVYTDIGADKSGTRDFVIHGQQLPVGVNGQPQPRLQDQHPDAGWHVFVHREAQLQHGAGVRRTHAGHGTDAELVIQRHRPANVARSGVAEVSATNWDAIIGVRGRARFGNDLRWFVPYYADVGGGDSKLTWQVILGAGYSFSWGDVLVAWRYLDYEFDSGQPVQSLTFNGLAAGVSFRF